MARRYAGLTWDHPRGHAALKRIAAEIAPAQGVQIAWDVQPLQGFESSSIASLCADYDLVVLDHPHIGEAVRAACLQPIETLLGEAELSEVGRQMIGPCLESYRYAGSTWALPLDAAAQVMAYRADLLDAPPPATWSEIEVVARHGGVALSLAGPHAILCLMSIATALGEPPATHDARLLVSETVGVEAYRLLAAVNRNAAPATAERDPIGILEHMACRDDVRLCPLIFGYVNYTRPGGACHAISFADAPAIAPGGIPGSTLGGAGIGISSRCRVGPELLDHLRWLVGDGAQRDLIPRNDGQPSRRSAWLDDAVNGDAGGFYKATADDAGARLRPPALRRLCRLAAESVRIPAHGPGRRVRTPGRHPRAQFHPSAMHWRSAAMSDNILVERDGHVGIITINRPEKLNAMTPEMADAMVATVNAFNVDDDIRCVILTGAGERAFCAGSDIRMLDDYDTPWNFRNRPDYGDAIRALLKPSIAAVNGYALGGGLETAMSCDIRIASSSASFAAPEIKLGWIGGGGMAVNLSHAVGPSNAALMIMTGDPIDAATAERWGLVSRVVPPGELMLEAKKIAAVIASRAPIAAETAKLNLRAAWEMSIADAIAYERDLQTICFATEDAQEGRAAFKEKRSPDFHRR